MTSLKRLMMESTKKMILKELKELKRGILMEISNAFLMQDKIKEDIKKKVTLKLESFEYKMTQRLILFTNHFLEHLWNQVLKTPQENYLGSKSLKEILDKYISLCNVVLVHPSITARNVFTSQSNCVLSENGRYTIPQEIEFVSKTNTSSFIDKENDESPNSMKFLSEPLQKVKYEIQTGCDIVDSDFKISSQVELSTENMMKEGSNLVQLPSLKDKLKNPEHTSQPLETLRCYPKRHLLKRKTDVLDLIDESNFMVKYINEEIGKGVFSKKKFFKGEPLFEYKGILKECKFLEADDDTYIFEFKFKDKIMVIDASEDDGSLGRLINDECFHPNIFPKLFVKEEEPHIIFKAKKDIEADDEIRYNYGGKSYFWRQKVSSWKPSWLRNVSS